MQNFEDKKKSKRAWRTRLNSSLTTGRLHGIIISDVKSFFFVDSMTRRTVPSESHYTQQSSANRNLFLIGYSKSSQSNFTS